MRKVPLSVAVAIAFTGLFAAGTAAAANPATGSFNVTANVQGSCRVTSTSDIAFGTYDPADVNASTPLDQNGSVSVRCVKGIDANVALDQGQNGTGTCAAPVRAMKEATSNELLAYEIYSDSGHASAWGCDAGNDVNFTAAASNADTVLTTYGRIPAGQNVGLGADFSDVVQVSVTF
jgi:spore coat protein U-like protein